MGPQLGVTELLLYLINDIIAKMEIFDTHCHYALSPLKENWQTYWQEAQAAGVKKSLVVGVDPDTTTELLELALQTENLWISVGCHPGNCQIGVKVEPGQIKSALKKYLPGQKILAVGETGLDFFGLDKSQAEFEQLKNIQLELFQAQIELAIEYRLPLILHVRDQEAQMDNKDNAYALVIKTLQKYDFGDKSVIFHCFSGSEAYLKSALALPHSYISLAGNVTYKNARSLQALAAMIPLDRVLVETDAPFLSPGKYRGQRPCEPAFIRETVEFLEQEFGISPEKLYNNTLSCFNLA